MQHRFLVSVSAVVAALTASNAQAAPEYALELILNEAELTYEVRASDVHFDAEGPNDNFGIWGYNIPLLNVTSSTNVGPVAYSSGSAIGGFSDEFFWSDSPAVGGQAFSNSGGQWVLGFGQTSGNLADQFPTADSFTTQIYDANLLLVTGGYASGLLPEIDFSDATLTVIVDPDTSDITEATIVPEPASLALLGLGGLAALRRRR